MNKKKKEKEKEKIPHRNPKNKEYKRPVCSCGHDMTYVSYEGYYDTRDYWICENPNCDQEEFFPDIESKGSYTY